MRKSTNEKRIHTSDHRVVYERSDTHKWATEIIPLKLGFIFSICEARDRGANERYQCQREPRHSQMVVVVVVVKRMGHRRGERGWEDASAWDALGGSAPGYS